MRNINSVLLLSLFTIISACGGGNEEPTPPPPPPPPDIVPAAFAEVDARANAVFNAQGLRGMGLTIYDAQGTKRFEKMYGAFSPDQRVSIASSSKLVAGLVMMRLIEQGYLTLDSSTGSVLGWTGPQAAITLRQLLSFTSGLQREAPCTLVANATLADCVAVIAQQPLVATPGTRFDYGSTHLQVAARMAEVATGQSWSALFENQLKTPLGLNSSNLAWYTLPRQVFGVSNPLIAGGLRATMNEYAKLLALVFNRGSYQGTPLISAAQFDAQATEPYPDAVIGNSPYTNSGLAFHYGLTAWLECPPPAVKCEVLSSAGALGFTPWLDRTGGYYAILAMESSGAHSGPAFWVLLQQELKPLITSALQAH